MVFLFSDNINDNRNHAVIQDIVRAHTLTQPSHDRKYNHKIEKQAPAKLPSLSYQGITANGTYFFCALAYKESMTAPQEVRSIFPLIDAYANAKSPEQHTELQSKIKKACGAQIEGIAFVFSDPKKTYGFISGTRIKIADLRDKQVRGKSVLYELRPHSICLNSEVTFTIPEKNVSSYSRLLNSWHIVTLVKETASANQCVQTYLQSNEINTDEINAIHCIQGSHQFFDEDMVLYLKKACAEIQDTTLRQQVDNLHSLLNTMISDKDRAIKYKVAALTIQLLHAQNNDERQVLLTEYIQLASELHGSQVPLMMILGLAVLLSGIALLFISVPTVSPLLVMSGGLLNILGGLWITTKGRATFYSDEAIQKRGFAMTLFSLEKTFRNISETDMPQLSTAVIPTW